jgi:hypothetical protein
VALNTSEGVNDMKIVQLTRFLPPNPVIPCDVLQADLVEYPLRLRNLGLLLRSRQRFINPLRAPSLYFVDLPLTSQSFYRLELCRHLPRQPSRRNAGAVPLQKPLAPLTVAVCLELGLEALHIIAQSLEQLSTPQYFGR